METNRMYRYARKLLDELFAAAKDEMDDIPKSLREQILRTKMKLEVLDEMDSIPPSLTDTPLPPSPAMPAAPGQCPGYVPDWWKPDWWKQNQYSPDWWKQYSPDWWKNSPGDAPWLQPTITCRGTACTSAADLANEKWPPKGTTTGNVGGQL